jgi:hypothetical protein
MTTDTTVRALLDRLRSVQHACDLDLPVFFSRHPRALLTSEQLVAYLGYDGDRIAYPRRPDRGGAAESLPGPVAAARLYVLGYGPPPKAALASLLKIAATRDGRQMTS